MKTRNRKYPRSSGMDGNKSRESGGFLFSRRVPDFCDGRRSFPTISLITNPPNCWAPSPPITQVSIFGTLSISGQIHRENQRENCGDYPIYLGRSAKSESPDCLGFSRHMKTRLLSTLPHLFCLSTPNPKQLIPSKARQLK